MERAPQLLQGPLASSHRPRVVLTEISNDSSGDEAICLAAAARFERAGASVTALYRKDLREHFAQAGLASVLQVRLPLRDEFPGVRTRSELVRQFATRHPRRFLRAVRTLAQADLLASVPGQKLMDRRPIRRNLALTALAQQLGVPTCFLHQSYGPISDPVDRTLVAEILSDCTAVLVRDDKSAELLRSIGVRPDRLVRCRDAVFGEPYAPPGAVEFGVGVNIRSGPGTHVTGEGFTRFVEVYRARRPDRRILVYTTTRDIPEDMQRRARALGCEVEPAMPRHPNYLRAIGRCAVNVSDSYHGVLFSMLAGRPVISCQPDYASFKLEGIHGAPEDAVVVMPGLTSKREAERVGARVFALEDDASAALASQARIVALGRALCEAGWSAVLEPLRVRAAGARVPSELSSRWLSALRGIVGLPRRGFAEGR